jgi:ABC-2 type transport system permease protein
MKLSKAELTGTGEVFSFTLRQYFKSKGNLITNIIVLLIALISMPVLSILSDRGMVSVGGTGSAFEDTTSIEHLCIYNETDLMLENPDLSQSIYWRDAQVGTVRSDTPELGSHDALVTVAKDGASYAVNASGSEESKLGASDLEAAAELVRGMVASALMGTDLTAQQQEILSAPYTVTQGDATSDAAGEGNSASFGARFTVQYGYAIIVLILCMTSSAYIIRAVLEEKSSKLVELMLVSVKPLALLVGKILAVMTHTFVFLVALIACMAISCGVTSLFLNGTVVTGVVGQVTSMMPAMEVDVGHILGLIAIILVSLLLAYLTIALMSGVSGACCSSMEEMNGANGTVTTFVMLGYLISCVTCGISSGAVSAISSLVPVVSTFCAPVQYVLGNISLWMLLLSWLIQIGVICLLALGASRVYAALVIHRGNRIKWKELCALAGFGKKEAA